MVHTVVCCLGPKNTLLGSPEDCLRLHTEQGQLPLCFTTPFWRVFNNMDVDCSNTAGLRAGEWARVGFHLPASTLAKQCRLDLGTVKIQIGIAMSGPALADGSLLGYYNSGYICIGRWGWGTLVMTRKASDVSMRAYGR